MTIVKNYVGFGRGVCWPGEIPALPATRNSASLVSQAGGISRAKGIPLAPGPREAKSL